MTSWKRLKNLLVRLVKFDPTFNVKLTSTSTSLCSGKHIWKLLVKADYSNKPCGFVQILSCLSILGSFVSILGT